MFAHTCGNGLFAHDALGWIAGTELWYDGHLIGHVEDSPKQVIAMGNRIVIYPDKVILNASYKRLGTYSSLSALKAAVTSPKEFDAYGVGTEVPYEIYVWNSKEWVSNGKELENMEVRRSFTSVSFLSGTYKGVPADANTMELPVNVEGLGFKPGDGVTISGCTTHPENNKTAIIREIEGKQLRFYENCFLLDGEKGLDSYKEPGTITISRTVPDLDVLCAVDNRLWGAKDDTIYASKLGDPTNFYVFDGLTDDSWTQETGTPGSFTACVSYLGYPMFFKEGHIFKIYGKNAENFQPSKSATMGVKQGAEKSLAVAGEVLYYLCPTGVVAYTGGIPESVATPFGEVRYSTAVCGSDGRRLYMSMKRQDGETELFCLDTDTGMLCKEDGLDVTGWCCHEGLLYAVQPEGSAVIVNRDEGACRDSMAEFGDFMEQSMERKGVTRLQLRVELDEGAELQVQIRYNSAGDWQNVRTLTATKKRSYSMPVRVKRCDHYRIRLLGKGYWELQSMAREYITGSGVH
ncbi:MAG: hypothetical protein J6J43_01200 [Oscillospiraceae bacterium]|nr:hypothetical protein [Oscillospiraceae bacterium]